MSLTVERRPWPRNPKYLVGDDGSVVGPRGRQLRAWLTRGYPCVGAAVVGSRQRGRPVHVMVCETFHGPRPDGHQAAHRNGIRTDNRAENLRWATKAENDADKARHGTNAGHRRGERHCRAKLTDDQVRAIRAAYASGAVTKTELAARYGMARSSVSGIVRRETWAHVA